MNWWRPTQIGKSTSPMTSFLDSSKFRTISALARIFGPSNLNWLNVFFGNTLNEEHVSTRTLETKVYAQVIEMCKALLWLFPLAINYASLKPKYRLAMILAITSSNGSTIMSCITWTSLITFSRALWWASKLSRNDKIEILEEVWSSWSTILKSLFLIRLRNYCLFFAISFSIYSCSLTTSLPLEVVTYSVY